MMSFRIRKASLSDAPALADLLRQIGWWAAFEEETSAANTAHVTRMLALDLASNCHSVYILWQILYSGCPMNNPDG
jgi:hypothetical protein